MKYLSFFSGIGAFEIAIQELFPDAECIGYSEIKKTAIKVYENHFEDHVNLGDITKISNAFIKKYVKENGGCDLIIGGFPCTNLTKLSNLTGNNEGLKGKQSKLFYELLRIIKTVKSINKNVKFILENNASMKIENKELITNILNKELKQVHLVMLDNSTFGVQTRKRLFWSNFYIPTPRNNTSSHCSQEWEDVLEPNIITKEYEITDKRVEYLNQKIGENNTNNSCYYIKKIKNKYCFNTRNSDMKCRIQKYPLHSDNGSEKDTFYPSSYPVGKSRPIVSNSNLIIDRRNCKKNQFIIRHLTPIEIERLFGFQDNYTDILTENERINVLGNSICVLVLKYILKHCEF